MAKPGSPAAALGFRVHSGWTCSIAVTGSRTSPEVVDRRRIELVDRATSASAQPYHAAARLDLEQAERLVAESGTRARILAEEGIRRVRDQLQQAGMNLVACAILMGSGRPASSLAATLASHAAIHTAEGNLFRAALIEASAECGLEITQVTEREVYSYGERILGVPPEGLKPRLADLGRELGRPWRQDEKLATLVAWLALAEPTHSRDGKR